MFLKRSIRSRFLQKQVVSDWGTQLLFSELGFPEEELLTGVDPEEAVGDDVVVSEKEIADVFFPFMHELDVELHEDNDAFARSVFSFLKDDVRRSYMYRLIQRFNAGSITAAAARNLVCLWAGLSMSCADVKDVPPEGGHIAYDPDAPAGQLYLAGSEDGYGLRFHYFAFTPAEAGASTKQYFEDCGFFDPERGISYETWLAQLLKFNYQLSHSQGGEDFRAFAEYLMGKISKDSELSIHMAIPLHLNHEQLRPVEFEYYQIQQGDNSLMSIMRRRGVESLYFMQKIQSQVLDGEVPGRMQDIVTDPDTIHVGNYIIVPKEGFLDPIDEPAQVSRPTVQSSPAWTPALPPETETRADSAEPERFDLEQISEAMLNAIGEKIYFNECSGRPDRLVAWNDGEDFPSLGIGHNTWKSNRDMFPQFLDFCRGKGIVLPFWLDSGDRPWTNKAAFLADSERRLWLENFLEEQKAVQVAFIQLRFQEALPRILEHVPEAQKAVVQQRFEALQTTPEGLFALIDYINFKGESARPQKSYGNVGWGCASVLMEMRDGESISATAFAEAAKRVLARRVDNAPTAKKVTEQGWLVGWNARMDRYKLSLGGESRSSDEVAVSGDPESVVGTTHVVVRGDTLWGLSQKYGVSTAAIKRANNLDSDTIGLGQRLIIPISSGVESVDYPSDPLELPKWNPGDTRKINVGASLFQGLPGGEVVQQTVDIPETAAPVSHTVVGGDTLWRLSRRYGISEDAIKAANGLKSDTIGIGQALIIPVGSDAGFVSESIDSGIGKSYSALQQEAEERGNALSRVETQDQVHVLRDRLKTHGVSLWSSGQGYKETGWGEPDASGRTLLRNMAHHTIDGLLFFFETEGFDSVDLSGGSEGLNGHNAGIFGHANGRKVDIRFTKDGRDIQAYIAQHGTQIANVSRGPVYYFTVSGVGADGKPKTYEYEAIIEGNHIDLAVLAPQDIAYRIKRYERMNLLVAGVSAEDFPGA